MENARAQERLSLAIKGTFVGEMALVTGLEECIGSGERKNFAMHSFVLTGEKCKHSGNILAEKKTPFSWLV